MPIVNLLPLQENEKVTELHAYNDSSKAESLLFITSQGIVKRTPIQEFYNINRNGKIAITLNEGDQLAFVKSTLGDEEIVIAGDNGKAIRFKETEVRQMSRTASGVRGFDTAGGHVVGAATSSEGNMIFALSENGYGKQSLLDSYRLTSRGKKGVRTLNVTGKTGALVALKAVTGDEDALIATQNGQIIRVHLHNISVLGRNTQGVRVVKPNENDKVYQVTLVDHEEQDSAGDLPENLKEELPVLEGELVRK